MKNFLNRYMGLIFFHPRQDEATDEATGFDWMAGSAATAAGGTPVSTGSSMLGIGSSVVKSAVSGGMAGSAIPGIGTVAGAVIGAGTSIISGLLQKHAQEKADAKNRELYDQKRNDDLKEQAKQDSMAMTRESDANIHTEEHRKDTSLARAGNIAKDNLAFKQSQLSSLTRA